MFWGLFLFPLFFFFYFHVRLVDGEQGEAGRAVPLEQRAPCLGNLHRGRGAVDDGAKHRVKSRRLAALLLQIANVREHRRVGQVVGEPQLRVQHDRPVVRGQDGHDIAPLLLQQKVDDDVQRHVDAHHADPPAANGHGRGHRHHRAEPKGIHIRRRPEYLLKKNKK